MKKYLLTLVLGFVLIGLTGCQFKMDISEKTEVDEEEFAEFLEDIFEDEDFFEEMQFEFKYEYESTHYYDEGKQSSKLTLKGRADISEDEAKMFYEGNSKEVEYDFEKGDKVKYTTTIKEEGVLFYDYEDDEEDAYIKGKYKYSSKYESESEEYKTQETNDTYLMNEVEDILDILGNYPGSFAGSAKYYIDEDKACVVSASQQSNLEIIFVLDGNELSALRISYQDGSNKWTYEYEFKEIKEIQKPKDAGQYDEADEDK